MKIKSFEFSPFGVNTYILSDDTKECVIIDPACYDSKEQKILIHYIEENQLKPVFILNTHCHVDHIFGNTFVKNYFQIPVCSHQSDDVVLDAASVYASSFGLEITPPPARDKHIGDGDEISFGHSMLKVYHTPGHTPGGVIFYSETDNFIISGDVLFNGSIGRTDLPGGDYDVLQESLKTKILILNPKCRVYPGHMDSTTIEDELKSNPFL